MRAQIAAFVEGGADMVTAYTLNSINEAIGVARAARALADSCGDLVHRGDQWPPGKGETLREAIETVDRETDSTPEYFLINCAHPTHFEDALKAGEAWTARIHGVRANASTKSHAELDESDNAGCGRSVRSRAALSEAQGRVSEDAHSRRLLRHRSSARQAICEACVPPPALSA